MKVLDYGAERKWQGLSALSVPLLPKPRFVAFRARLTLPEPPGRCAVVTARADGKREVRERVLRAWPGVS